MTTTPNIIIRPAAPNDMDQIHALEQACSQNPWSRNGLSEEISNPDAAFLVAETPPPQSQIAAFACASMILDEMHILDVIVRQNYRNQGLGSTLVNSLLSTAAAKRATRACLEVRTSNRAAIKLYEKCGFKRDGVRKGYYQNGEDAALMSAEL